MIRIGSWFLERIFLWWLLRVCLDFVGGLVGGRLEEYRWSSLEVLPCRLGGLVVFLGTYAGTLRA